MSLAKSILKVDMSFLGFWKKKHNKYCLKLYIYIYTHIYMSEFT